VKNSVNDCISSWNYSFDGALMRRPRKSRKSDKIITFNEVQTGLHIFKKENRNKSERLSPIKLGKNIQSSLIDSTIISKILENRRKGAASRVNKRSEVNKKNQETVNFKQVFRITSLIESQIKEKIELPKVSIANKRMKWSQLSSEYFH
jgi:hypothetical protein